VSQNFKECLPPVASKSESGTKIISIMRVWLGCLKLRVDESDDSKFRVTHSKIKPHNIYKILEIACLVANDKAQKSHSNLKSYGHSESVKRLIKKLKSVKIALR